MNTGATVPGLEPYSKLWVEATCTHVPEPLVPVVSAIAEAYYLDSAAPNSLAHIIEASLRVALSGTHILHRGLEVHPKMVVFSERGWTWRGQDDQGHVYAYGSDDIQGRKG